MDDVRLNERAWVATTVRLLNAEKSWTGRMHIHKTLFILETLEVAETPFLFELYRYGPYSFGLDERIADMETYGHLSKTYPEPGYGPKYKCLELGRKDAENLPEDALAGLECVAKAVGGFDSTDLELAATCLWAEQRQGISKRDQIIPWVMKLKPQYDASQISDGLEKAHRLAKELASST